VSDGVQVLTCRFCSSEAVARFSMSAGCVCYPDDREQDLCVQHVLRATPLGTMQLVEDYSRGAEFTAWWSGRRETSGQPSDAVQDASGGATDAHCDQRTGRQS